MFRPFYPSQYGYWPSAGWTDSDSVLTTQLYDDGTNGDFLPGDNIWSKDIFFFNYPYFEIPYKYSANWGLPTNNGGNDNESTRNIHQIWITQNIITAKVNNVFGVMGVHQITDLVVADVEDEVTEQLHSYILEQNYPNPFNPITKIRYTIPNNVETRHGVSLGGYDVFGNEVATLVDEYKPTGSYEIEFSAKGGLASGIYFYQMRVNDFVATKKMIFLK
jgi:hypothetical protein